MTWSSHGVKARRKAGRCHRCWPTCGVPSSASSGGAGPRSTAGCAPGGGQQPALVGKQRDAAQQRVDPCVVRPVGVAPSVMTATSRRTRCGPACRVVWEGPGQCWPAPTPIGATLWRAGQVVAQAARCKAGAVVLAAFSVPGRRATKSCRPAASARWSSHACSASTITAAPSASAGKLAARSASAAAAAAGCCAWRAWAGPAKLCSVGACVGVRADFRA